MTETLVRTYHDLQQYQRDLEQQARAGWIVVGVRERYPRIGCLAALLTLVRWSSDPVRPRIVVTYRRARE